MTKHDIFQRQWRIRFDSKTYLFYPQYRTFLFWHDVWVYKLDTDIYSSLCEYSLATHIEKMIDTDDTVTARICSRLLTESIQFAQKLDELWNCKTAPRNKYIYLTSDFNTLT